MKPEIQVSKASPLAMVAELFQKDSNFTVDMLTKMMDVQERYEANEAKKAYTEAMALFKANPPRIKKDKHVKYGNTAYNHASLENVTSTINKALSEHGLTAAWKTEQQNNGSVTVTCIITHVLGHSEQTSLTSAPDASGSKNPIQAIGSAVSYLQRYTLLSLVGLATEGQDDDGKGTDHKPAAKWTKKQLQFVEKLAIALDETEAGKNVNLDLLKSYLENSYGRTNRPIPDKDELVNKVRDFILAKPDELEKMKGN